MDDPKDRVRIVLPRARWVSPPADLGTGDIVLETAHDAPVSEMGLLLSKAPHYVRVLRTEPSLPHREFEYVLGVSKAETLTERDVNPKNGARVRVVLVMEARSASYDGDVPEVVPLSEEDAARMLALYPETPACPTTTLAEQTNAAPKPAAWHYGPLPAMKPTPVQLELRFPPRVTRFGDAFPPLPPCPARTIVLTEAPLAAPPTEDPLP